MANTAKIKQLTNIDKTENVYPVTVAQAIFRKDDPSKSIEDSLTALESAGVEGDSAYEVAVKNGYKGTEQQWLESLKGGPGQKGDTGNGISKIEKVTTNTGSGESNTIRVIYTNGEQNEFTINNGAQGATGPQGPIGKPFAITKIYSSAAEMNAHYSSSEVSVGEFVLISTESTENSENSQLYVKGEKAFEFLTDLSGAQGIQGPAGPKGDTGDQGATGPAGKDGTNGKNGISVSHSWNGTTLTITSASGTTSSNLKGKSIAWGVLKDPTAVSDTHAIITSVISKHTRLVAPVTNPGAFHNGDLALLPGQYNDVPRQHYTMIYSIEKVNGNNLEGYAMAVIEEGLPGAQGPEGHTPVKGVDYWTASDKQSVVQDAAAAVDLSGYLAKPAGTAEGQFAVFGADGSLRGVTLNNLDKEAR